MTWCDFFWTEQEKTWCEERSIHLLSVHDSSYPSLLAHIYDPPPGLAVDGDVTALSQGILVAIVGSRKPTSYGMQFATELARDLSQRGATIVSGLAFGIDRAAHEGALNGGGKTVAVLASGIDDVTPRAHRSLAKRIQKQGAIVSEFSLGTPALPQHFPRRNRVISGLSHGVIVVEAAERSGSLITARCALEQGREVFAVPGLPGSLQASGTHHLIKNGAALIESANDVMEHLSHLPLVKMNNCIPEKAGQFSEAPDKRAVFTLEMFATERSLKHQEAIQMLASMVLTGEVDELPGKRFVMKGA
ncbi:MAG: DNA-protecting protein DprA [Deltaproteobacteria bacterium]|nr:DNA-protecting protein DprA [Deltaproteobacteria bacterium]